MYDGIASFADFCRPGADRRAVLRAYLEARSLEPREASLAGRRHLLVGPPSPGSRPRVVLVAHYDAVDGSPGANDNAAAVYQTAEAAARLRANSDRDWLCIFTDGEEAAAAAGAKGQGAYALALGFKALGLSDARFFILDACGRGDTLVVSAVADGLIGKTPGYSGGRARSRLRELRSIAFEAARKAAFGPALFAPVPFSDDAGFLAAGLPAQTATVLPAAEAAALSRALRCRPEAAGSLICEATGGGSPDLADALPRTWKLLNGPLDEASTLDATTFEPMVRFAVALCRG